MIITKIISSAIQKGRLLIKVLGYGNSDVRTALSLLPFGIDANPSKDLRAIYANTENSQDRVLIGVINKQVLAEVGEIRLYSEEAPGTLAAFIHLKKDGNTELGGNADNLARYSILEEEVHELRDNLNSLVTAFNGHVHATAAPGPPVPPTAVPNVIPASSSTIDISKAKIDNLLTS